MEQQVSVDQGDKQNQSQIQQSFEDRLSLTEKALKESLVQIEIEKKERKLVELKLEEKNQELQNLIEQEKNILKEVISSQLHEKLDKLRIGKEEHENEMKKLFLTISEQSDQIKILQAQLTVQKSDFERQIEKEKEKVNLISRDSTLNSTGNIETEKLQREVKELKQIINDMRGVYKGLDKYFQQNQQPTFENQQYQKNNNQYEYTKNINYDQQSADDFWYQNKGSNSKIEAFLNLNYQTNENQKNYQFKLPQLQNSYDKNNTNSKSGSLQSDSNEFIEKQVNQSQNKGKSVKRQNK